MKQITREVAIRLCTEENIKYLKSILSSKEISYLQGKNTEEVANNLVDSSQNDEDCERVINCLIVMNHYKNNKWWINKDKCVVAYFQLHTNVLLVPYEELLKATKILLQRNVCYNEIIEGKYINLQREAEKKFKTDSIYIV